MKKNVLLLLLSLCTLTLSAQESRTYRKGYRGNIEIGNYTIIGKDKYGGLAQITTSQGYSFGNGAYIGLGLGAGFDLGGSVYIPLFMDAKYNFIDNKVSPFASVRAGIRFSPEVDSYLSYGFAIGGGVDFGRYSVKLGYEYNAAKASIYSQGRYEEIYSKPSLLFCSFAFNF